MFQATRRAPQGERLVKKVQHGRSEPAESVAFFAGAATVLWGAPGAQTDGVRSAAETRAVVEDLILDRDSDLAAPIHGIAGVENEVDERGLQLRLVGKHRPNSFRNIHVETDGAAKAALQHLGDRTHRFAHLNKDRVDLLTARKGQKLPRQSGATLDNRLDGFGGGDGTRVSGVPLDNVRIASDRHEKIVEIMRHAAGELPACRSVGV
jgi:hypothetical protein